MARIAGVERLRQLVRPYDMGWPVIANICGPEKELELENQAGIIIALGEQIPPGSTNPLEQFARQYTNFVKDERNNYDWELPHEVPMPDDTSIRMIFDDMPVEVLHHNTTHNPAASDIVTVEFPRNREEEGTVRRLRMCHPFPGDKRWNPETTVFGRIGLLVDGTMVDVHTGEVINLDNLPRETVAFDENAKHGPGFELTKYCRNFWNILRGNRKININAIDPYSWVPQVTENERDSWLRYASNVPYEVMRGEIDNDTLQEFTFRMMGCFCINPKLFLNFTNYFHFSAIFPYFSKHEREYKFYEDVDDIPADVDGFTAFMVKMMGPDYDERLSVLGNLTSIFKIGIGEWRIPVGSDLVS